MLDHRSLCSILSQAEWSVISVCSTKRFPDGAAGRLQSPISPTQIQIGITVHGAFQSLGRLEEGSSLLAPRTMSQLGLFLLPACFGGPLAAFFTADSVSSLYWLKAISCCWSPGLVRIQGAGVPSRSKGLEGGILCIGWCRRDSMGCSAQVG